MKYILVLILPFLFLGGCAKKQEPKTKIVYVYKRFSMNGWWQLVGLNDVEGDKKIKLFLDQKKKNFYGNDGCNSILGVLQKADKEELVFGAVASTMMACEDMKSPIKYVKKMKLVKYYKVDDPYLYLYDENKNLLLKYKKSKK